MSGKHLHMAGSSITNNLHPVFTGGKARHPPPSPGCSSPKQLKPPCPSQFVIYTGAVMHWSASYPGDYATRMVCREFAARRDSWAREPALSGSEQEHVSSRRAAAVSVKQGWGHGSRQLPWHPPRAPAPAEPCPDPSGLRCTPGSFEVRGDSCV